MTIKQVLITSCIFITSLTQAIHWQDLDGKAYNDYVEKAIQTLCYVDQQLQWELHGSREIIRTGKGHADELYPRQKAALKAIVKELKTKAHKSHNKGDALLKSLFKHEIYKQWKRNFKKNYAHSVKSNDPFAWGWLHKRTNFFFLESAQQQTIITN